MFGGRDEEFDRFYREHHALIYNYAFWKLRDVAEAEDATVETFMRAWKSLRGRAFEGDSRAWLFTIAKNVCCRRAAQLAKRRIGTVPIEDHFACDGDLEKTSLLRQFVQQLLSLLPENQREAVWLHYGMQFTTAEIAAALSTPKGTVDAWIWRTAVRMRREFGDAAELGGAQ